MEPNKTFIIRKKDTQELFTARSGKTSWKAPGHAKNAFNQTVSLWNIKELGLTLVPRKNYYREYEDTPRFDEQDVWEIVELKLASETHLDKAKSLLSECVGRTPFELSNRIEEFLKEAN